MEVQPTAEVAASQVPVPQNSGFCAIVPRVKAAVAAQSKSIAGFHTRGSTVDQAPLERSKVYSNGIG
jgi:hypothetical protein